MTSSWEYTTPQLTKGYTYNREQKWRTVRGDSTPAKAMAARMREAIAERKRMEKDPFAAGPRSRPCIVTHARNKKMRWLWASPEGIDFLFGYRGDVYYDPMKLMEDKIDETVRSGKSDLERLAELHKRHQEKQGIENITESLHMLVTGLMGEGMKKKEIEYDKYAKAYTAKLSYHGFSIYITKEGR